MRFRLTSLLLVALALGVAGCGDASKPLTAAQLRTRASAVCANVTRRIVALQAHASEVPARTSLRRAADALTDGVDRLEALDPPEQLDDRYARFLAWKRAQRDAASAQVAGRPISPRSRRAVEAHDSPLQTLGRQLGVTGCS